MHIHYHFSFGLLSVFLLSMLYRLLMQFCWDHFCFDVFQKILLPFLLLLLFSFYISMLVSYGQQTMVHNGSSSCLNLIVIPPLRFVLRFVALLKTENVFVVYSLLPATVAN